MWLSRVKHALCPNNFFLRNKSESDLNRMASGAPGGRLVGSVAIALDGERSDIRAA